jgi:hypothetical protein
MTWMIPERRLDEYQLSVLRDCGADVDRNEWIQGFAGSGKTVIVVHLVQRILVTDPNARVCIAVFTHALKDMIQCGIQEQFKDRIPVMTYLHLINKDRRHYQIVVVDEVQDIPKANLDRIKELADRVIVAGDTDQSIYKHCSTSAEIQETFVPRTHRLMVVHRLTRRLLDIVRTILPNSLIEAARTDRMQEVQVTLGRAVGETEELEWVWHNCRRYAKQGEPAAVLLPSHELVQRFINWVLGCEGKGSVVFPLTKGGDWEQTNYTPANDFLEGAGVPLQYLGNKYGSLSESDNRPLTYVMTYHSAKGLDFETVLLPALNEDQVFWRNDDEIDRRLFFVGATRSRRNLFLSYHSEHPHAYVQGMPQQLLHHVQCEVTHPHLGNHDFEF